MFEPANEVLLQVLVLSFYLALLAAKKGMVYLLSLPLRNYRVLCPKSGLFIVGDTF